MSIATYVDLKNSVASYLNRSDLTSYIPDFIALCERRLWYGGEDPYPSQPVRVPAMQARSTGTITSNAIAFPTRYLEPIRLAGSSGGQNWTITYVSPASYAEASNSTGLPTVYTYLNNEIETAGTGNASYTLDYYQAFASLSADADTNWLLTNAPDVYLFGALLEAAPFVGDATQVSGWYGMFKSGVSSINRASKHQAGGAVVARVIV